MTFYTSELGQFALALAFGCALTGVAPLWHARLAQDAAWQQTGRRLALASAALVAVSFATLIAAFVSSDFSLLLVASHSQTLQPLAYRIAGAWGQHEGSLLLWLLVLCLCAAALARGRMDADNKARALGALAALGSAFAALSLFTSNPFARLMPPPLEGRDLNPLLQDPGLVIHPPLLYVGYVGASVGFALTVAALLAGRNDARVLKHWTRFAWTALTAGLALGSWWSYYELGWGGWWFWDPVENAALLPWLVLTALLHTLSVPALQRWSLWLALAAFACSLLGTFLVRSGLLTSVHAFASDPVRGLAILAVFVSAIGAAFWLYATRLPRLAPTGTVTPISRGGALLVCALLLCSGAGVVALGTLYPLIVSALDLPPISVGAPYFNLAALPLLVPLLFLQPFGPFLSVTGLGDAKRLVGPGLICGSLVAAAALYCTGWHGALALLGLAGGAWAVAGALIDLRQHWRAQHWPRWLAHLGIGIAALGMAAAPLDFGSTQAIAPGQQFAFAGYDFTVSIAPDRAGPNFTDRGLALTVTQDGQPVTTLLPAQRRFPAADITTTEAAILTTALGDLFATVSAPDAAGAVTLRLRYHPLQAWIWLGAIVMVTGGTVGMMRRRG